MWRPRAKNPSIVVKVARHHKMSRPASQYSVGSKGSGNGANDGAGGIGETGYKTEHENDDIDATVDRCAP